MNQMIHFPHLPDPGGAADRPADRPDSLWNHLNCPPCLLCDSAPAELHPLKLNPNGDAFFCSIECAAAFGLNAATAAGKHFCQDCKLWSDELGGCPGCGYDPHVHDDVVFSPRKESEARP